MQEALPTIEEIMLMLRELYSDPAVPATVRMKAIETVLAYLTKQSPSESEDMKKASEAEALRAQEVFVSLLSRLGEAESTEPPGPNDQTAPPSDA